MNFFFIFFINLFIYFLFIVSTLTTIYKKYSVDFVPSQGRVEELSQTKSVLEPWSAILNSQFYLLLKSHLGDWNQMILYFSSHFIIGS